MKLAAALLVPCLISLAAIALTVRFSHWHRDTVSSPQSYRLPDYWGYLALLAGFLFFWGPQLGLLQQGVIIPPWREALVALLSLGLPLTVAAYVFDFRIAVETEKMVIRRWWRTRDVPWKDITDTALFGFRTRSTATLTIYLRNRKRLRFDGSFLELEDINAAIRSRMAGPPRGHRMCAEKQADLNRMGFIIATGFGLLFLLVITLKILEWIHR